MNEMGQGASFPSRAGVVQDFAAKPDQIGRFTVDRGEQREAQLGSVQIADEQPEIAMTHGLP